MVIIAFSLGTPYELRISIRNSFAQRSDRTTERTTGQHNIWRARECVWVCEWNISKAKIRPNRIHCTFSFRNFPFLFHFSFYIFSLRVSFCLPVLFSFYFYIYIPTSGSRQQAEDRNLQWTKREDLRRVNMEKKNWKQKTWGKFLIKCQKSKIANYLSVYFAWLHSCFQI